MKKGVSMKGCRGCYHRFINVVAMFSSFHHFINVVISSFHHFINVVISSFHHFINVVAMFSSSSGRARTERLAHKYHSLD